MEGRGLRGMVSMLRYCLEVELELVGLFVDTSGTMGMPTAPVVVN